MKAWGAWLNEAYRTLLWLPEQASSRAADLDHFQFLVFTVMALVTLGIAAATAVFVWRYRRRPDHPSHDERIVAPLWLELGVYGAILASFVGFWVIGIRQYLDMGRAPEGALEVYVTGKQWMWKFAYPNGASSAGVLYVPSGRAIRLLITSRDVIHSFFVPDFRLKRDAVPGRYTGLWFEAPKAGRHSVFCAEMCGTGHAQMLAEVVVLEPEAFRAWLDGGSAPAGSGPSGPGLVARGRQVARDTGCLQCHSLDGKRGIGPSWKGAYGAKVEFEQGPPIQIDESYLTRSMMDPRAQIVKGYAPVMPSYQGQIEAGDVASIVALIKSLRSPGPESAPAAGDEAGQHEAPPEATKKEGSP